MKIILRLLIEFNSKIGTFHSRGVVLWGRRVIVPESLSAKTLSLLFSLDKHRFDPLPGIHFYKLVVSHSWKKKFLLSSICPNNSFLSFVSCHEYHFRALSYVSPSSIPRSNVCFINLVSPPPPLEFKTPTALGTQRNILCEICGEKLCVVTQALMIC